MSALGTSLRCSMLALLVGAGAAWACRGPFRPLEENVQAADVIIVGEFLSVRELGPNESLPQSKDVELTFKVEQTLKGQASGRLVVRSTTTTCGYGRGLSAGQRVLLFARGAPLGTSMTSGNAWLDGGATEKSLVAQVRQLVAAR